MRRYPLDPTEPVLVGVLMVLSLVAITAADVPRTDRAAAAILLCLSVGGWFWYCRHLRRPSSVSRPVGQASRLSRAQCA